MYAAGPWGLLLIELLLCTWNRENWNRPMKADDGVGAFLVRHRLMWGEVGDQEQTFIETVFKCFSLKNPMAFYIMLPFILSINFHFTGRWAYGCAPALKCKQVMICMHERDVKQINCYIRKKRTIQMIIKNFESAIGKTQSYATTSLCARWSCVESPKSGWNRHR